MASESVIVEIRAAEGGADAKDLVGEQLAVYAKFCAHLDLSCEIIDTRSGAAILEVTGAKAARSFASEPGGHRWQRVPPTEKHGRRHTSTVTVAVLPVTSREVAALDERDIEWTATRGSGAGGQARNKTSNAVQMRHKPSRFTVRVESSRSQPQNREAALRILAARLADEHRSAHANAEANARRGQVGSGMRGDKIRTVRLQDDSVVDHRTGKRTSAARYLRGFVSDLQERA